MSHYNDLTNCDHLPYSLAQYQTTRCCINIRTQCVLWYTHKSHLQPLPIKTIQAHLLLQKEALNEAYILTMQVLITTSGQTFCNIKPLVSKANIPQSGVQGNEVFTCAYIHAQPSTLVQSCAHLSALLQIPMSTVTTHNK